jgi:hypothetical protein
MGNELSSSLPCVTLDITPESPIPSECRECLICYSSFDEANIIQATTDEQPCGHVTVCIACLSKQFKQECPYCRAPNKVKITGTIPSPSNEIPPELLEMDQDNNNVYVWDEFRPVEYIVDEIIDAYARELSTVMY